MLSKLYKEVEPMILGLLCTVIFLPSILSAQTIITTPSTHLTWTQPAATLQEANEYRITAYTQANADKILANINDATATPFGQLTFTCANVSGGFTCTSTSTAGQLAATTNPGNYKVVLVAERRKADGTYATKVVSQVCNFQFQDNAPSLAPTNIRFV